MASIASIAAGLETNLQTIPGLRVQDIFEGTVSVPAAVVDLPESIQFDRVFQRGADTLSLVVVVLVSKANERGGRVKLMDYLSTTGATSVKTAIETDKTLGGAADSIRVTRAEGIGPYDVAGVSYLGARFVVEVIA